MGHAIIALEMMTVELRLCKRDSFLICGHDTETSLQTCGTDLERLWRSFEHEKQELYNRFGAREDFYGLMWKAGASKDNYSYLIGIEIDQTTHPLGKSVVKQIHAAEYAVASVPSSLSAFDAWTVFYNTALPGAGYIPADRHLYDFEYYPHGAGKDYELWTPVQRKG